MRPDDPLAEDDPAVLAAAFHRVADELRAVNRASEERDAELAAKEQELARRDRVNRRLIWGLIVSLALDLIITVALAALAIEVRHNAASNANLCLSGNAARVQQVQLWDYLLKLGRQPKTAAQRKDVAAFKAHLGTLFAPRDCSRIDPRHP
jgi:hypothetical protein